jgi:hypothetical protein
VALSGEEERRRGGEGEGERERGEREGGREERMWMFDIPDMRIQ